MEKKYVVNFRSNIKDTLNEIVTYKPVLMLDIKKKKIQNLDDVIQNLSDILGTNRIEMNIVEQEPNFIRYQLTSSRAPIDGSEPIGRTGIIRLEDTISAEAYESVIDTLMDIDKDLHGIEQTLVEEKEDGEMILERIKQEDINDDKHTLEAVVEIEEEPIIIEWTEETKKKKTTKKAKVTPYAAAATTSYTEKISDTSYVQPVESYNTRYENYEAAPVQNATPEREYETPYKNTLSSSEEQRKIYDNERRLAEDRAAYQNRLEEDVRTYQNRQQERIDNYKDVGNQHINLSGKEQYDYDSSYRFDQPAAADDYQTQTPVFQTETPRAVEHYEQDNNYNQPAEADSYQSQMPTFQSETYRATEHYELNNSYVQPAATDSYQTQIPAFQTETPRSAERYEQNNNYNQPAEADSYQSQTPTSQSETYRATEHYGQDNSYKQSMPADDYHTSINQREQTYGSERYEYDNSYKQPTKADSYQSQTPTFQSETYRAAEQYEYKNKPTTNKQFSFMMSDEGDFKTQKIESSVIMNADLAQEMDTSQRRRLDAKIEEYSNVFASSKDATPISTAEMQEMLRGKEKDIIPPIKRVESETTETTHSKKSSYAGVSGPAEMPVRKSSLEGTQVTSLTLNAFDDQRKYLNNIRYRKTMESKLKQLGAEIGNAAHGAASENDTVKAFKNISSGLLIASAASRILTSKNDDAALIMLTGKNLKEYTELLNSERAVLFEGSLDKILRPAIDDITGATGIKLSDLTDKNLTELLGRIEEGGEIKDVLDGQTVSEALKRYQQDISTSFKEDLKFLNNSEELAALREMNFAKLKNIKFETMEDSDIKKILARRTKDILKAGKDIKDDEIALKLKTLLAKKGATAAELKYINAKNKLLRSAKSGVKKMTNSNDTVQGATIYIQTIKTSMKVSKYMLKSGRRLGKSGTNTIKIIAKKTGMDVKFNKIKDNTAARIKQLDKYNSIDKMKSVKTQLSEIPQKQKIKKYNRKAEMKKKRMDRIDAFAKKHKKLASAAKGAKAINAKFTGALKSIVAVVAKVAAGVKMAVIGILIMLALVIIFAVLGTASFPIFMFASDDTADIQVFVDAINAARTEFIDQKLTYILGEQDINGNDYGVVDVYGNVIDTGINTSYEDNIDLNTREIISIAAVYYMQNWPSSDLITQFKNKWELWFGASDIDYTGSAVSDANFFDFIEQVAEYTVDFYGVETGPYSCLELCDGCVIGTNHAGETIEVQDWSYNRKTKTSYRWSSRTVDVYNDEGEITGTETEWYWEEYEEVYYAWEQNGTYEVTVTIPTILPDEANTGTITDIPSGVWVENGGIISTVNTSVVISDLNMYSGIEDEWFYDAGEVYGTFTIEYVGYDASWNRVTKYITYGITANNVVYSTWCPGELNDGVYGHYSIDIEISLTGAATYNDYGTLEAITRDLNDGELISTVEVKSSDGSLRYRNEYKTTIVSGDPSFDSWYDDNGDDTGLVEWAMVLYGEDEDAWLEMYGVTYGITCAKIGNPLTDEELEALMAALGDLDEFQYNIVQAALSGVGLFSYEMGGKSSGGANNASTPSALDCSGFVQWVYWTAGYDFSLVNTYDYPGSDVVEISQSQLEPGDICMLEVPGSSSNHVRIYIGNGQYVECVDGYGSILNSWSEISNGGHAYLRYYRYVGF